MILTANHDARRYQLDLTETEARRLRDVIGAIELSEGELNEVELDNHDIELLTRIHTVLDANLPQPPKPGDIVQLRARVREEGPTDWTTAYARLLGCAWSCDKNHWVLADINGAPSLWRVDLYEIRKAR